jgi:hypothetical protein
VGRFLRGIRSVLAPNGSSSNAPAVIAVGSGPVATGCHPYRIAVAWSHPRQLPRRRGEFNAEAQRFAEPRRGFFPSAFLRAPRRLCVRTGLALAAALPRGALALSPDRRARGKKNQAGLGDRPDLLLTDCVSNYAVRLRSIRSVLAPNGTSSSAPAIIVVGSGTGVNIESPIAVGLYWGGNPYNVY